MRGANWHEVGGNAKMLKGDEQQVLSEHCPPRDQRSQRGSHAIDQPAHAKSVYQFQTRRVRF